MTFLDDYEAYYKLRGIEIISQFIDRVPTGLIERTGIDGLIKTVCLFNSSYSCWGLLTLV